jgi:chromosomal replication initiator protein
VKPSWRIYPLQELRSMSRRPLSFSRLLDLPEIHSALVAVKNLAESTESYRKPLANLLYLFGPQGTGKSALVKALELEVLRRSGAAVVVCLPAKELDSFVAAHSEGLGEQTRSLEDLDLLLIEDLQHLPARLGHSLGELIDDFTARRVSLVCTASVGPYELPFSGRLTNRLASGLVVELESWKADSRLKFLQAKAQERQLAIRQEILTWLATHTPGSGRELEGALNRLSALSSMQPTPLTLANVSGHFQSEIEAARPTVSRIVARVSDQFRVSAAELVSTRRNRSILLPRQVSMYLARRLTDLSLTEIGEEFGGRDHSTVLHACQKVGAALTQDRYLAGKVSQLQAALT